MKPLLRIESRLALLIGALFGVPAVVFVPPVVTFDGPSHYGRALQVSKGQMRAERYSERAVGGTLPRSHYDFLNTLLWNYYWKPKPDYLTRAQWSSISIQSESAQGTLPVEFTNTAIYSPVNYVFQSLGMRLAAALSPAPLLANWLGCLFNLAGYLLLVVIAIECSPRFHRGILLLASSPLLVIQASSLSADPVNFALPLLVLAWTWRLRVADVRHPALEMACVLALGLFVTLLKPVLVAALLCLLLIPAGRFGGKWPAKAAALTAYFLLVGGVWIAWNRANLEVDIARWYHPERPPLSVQRQWFLENPLRFARPLLFTLKNDLAGQWPHLYGDPGGWVSGGAFRFNAVLSLVFLAGFLGCASWGETPSQAWAAGMLAVSVALVFVTGLTLWLAFGTVGMGYIPGFVGRYLFVPAMAFGMFWAELFHKGLGRIRGILFWTALAANVAGLTAIVATVAMRTW